MVVLILHNLRSSHNVGAIFRTAEAVGVQKIYLTGYTPSPLDEFDRPNKEIAKTALGAERIISWGKIKNIFRLLDNLKTKTYQLVALEQTKNSLDYNKVKLELPVAIVVGNEVTGLTPTVLKHCNLIAEIPMRGRKESLNVAVATGIALFRWLDN